MEQNNEYTLHLDPYVPFEECVKKAFEEYCERVNNPNYMDKQPVMTKGMRG